MTRNNSSQHVVDITGDILFSRVTLNGNEVALLRLYGFIKGTAGAAPVEGLRFVAYGPLAELIYAYVRKGSRLFVLSHVQQRITNGRFFTEFVIEEAQFIHNVDFEAGKIKKAELVRRGELRPGRYDDEDMAG